MTSLKPTDFTTDGNFAPSIAFDGAELAFKRLKSLIGLKRAARNR